MKFIEESFIDGETTVQKVSYKGNVWERRENNKLIHWFIYTDDSNKRFMYQCILNNNSWRRYINNSTPPEAIGIPYIERSYLKKISIKKLYKFKLDVCYTVLYGMFVATEIDVKNAIGKSIAFEEVVSRFGKVSGILEWEHLEELDVHQSTIDNLLENNNSSNWTIVGYNPLEYMQEYES